MKILIAYDGSGYADAALEDLRRAGLPGAAEALVVCVADDGTLPPLENVGMAEKDYPNAYRARIAEAEALNERATGRIRSLFADWSVSSEALWGAPARAVLKTVERWRPDLLVAGSHGRSAAVRLLLGSVSLKLLHEAPCSVRVVRNGPMLGRQPIRILIGADGSSHADGAVREVARRFWPQGTEVRVMAIVETLEPAAVPALDASVYAGDRAFGIIKEADAQARARLRNASEEAAKSLRNVGLAVSTTVIDGDARADLVAEAKRWNADAIFVGARGLSGLERVLLGSVSTAAVTHAPCTVEVVRRF